MKRRFLKLLKVAGAIVSGLLLILFLIPVLFPGKIVQKVKAWTNQSIDGELNFSKVKLSFFNHFPSLTLTLHDVSLKGSSPFKKDTLLTADELALGIDLGTLIFDHAVNIDEIYISKADINVLVNKKGEANYNIYLPAKKSGKVKQDTSGTSLKLEKIVIEKTTLRYNDESTALQLNASNFNYTGNGELSEDLFDLYSDIQISSMDLRYDGEPYMTNKKVNADLITRINTESLSFIFRQNKIMVNELPVQFTGKMDFLKNGYYFDFTVSSSNSKLSELFTAFPPQYLEWLKKTEVKGNTDLLLTFKGPYIVAQNKLPDLTFDMKVSNGYILHQQSPLPLSDLYLDVHTKMPSLNTGRLDVKADSFSFKVGNDFLRSSFHINGMSHPDIVAKIVAQLDLEKADRAVGFSSFDIRGSTILNADIRGTYNPEKNLLPAMNAAVQIRNGYLKTSLYPQPVDQIQLDVKLDNATGAMKDMKVVLQPLSFAFAGQPFTASANLSDFDNINYAIKAKGDIDVAKISKVFSSQDLQLNGFVGADLSLQGTQSDAMNGNYNKLNNAGTLRLSDIRIGSKYFPLPFLIRKGLFTFHQDKVSFDDFKGAYGESDFTMNGYLQNLIDHIFSSTGVLQGNFSIRSENINVNEFSFPVAGNPAKNDSSQSAYGVVIIPPNYNLSLKAYARKVRFNDLNLDSLAGEVSINKGTLSLKDAGFGIIGCRTMMNMTYSAPDLSKAMFDYHVVAKDFDIKKAYDSIAIFREIATAAGKAQGIVSLDYQLKGVLDASMRPVYPSLEGGGTLSVKDVKVSGLKLFSVVAEKISNDSINNPNLRKINIKSSIKNNVVTVERFKFKVFGFRPRIEGKTNFDGQLDLRMRLGLPPLGIIGIPIKVSGTQDDPVVKLGRRNKEEVKETIYGE